MAYVSFISDEDLLRCIRELHQSYERCKRNSTVDKFYSNKVDPIKFQFDMAFNDIDEEAYIKSEILTKKELVFEPTNYYYEMLKGRIGDDKKDENNKKSIQTG